MSDLKQRVETALNNARENRYYAECYDWEPIRTAIDMTNFRAELANEEPGDLVPHIEDWRKANVRQG